MGRRKELFGSDSKRTVGEESLCARGMQVTTEHLSPETMQRMFELESLKQNDRELREAERGVLGAALIFLSPNSISQAD